MLCYRKAAMDWMREQGSSEEDMLLMQSKLKIKWLENQPTVPPGWKTRKSKVKTNVSVPVSLREKKLRIKKRK